MLCAAKRKREKRDRESLKLREERMIREERDLECNENREISLIAERRNREWVEF